jgi:hypothetical protein
MATLETATEIETTPLQWGSDAPRGGQAVFRRILKDGSKVPLFLGQTLVHSLRDLGYNHTTSAVCEHVDNAIQWGATEIRVYFHQTGKRGNYQIDTLVFDNGSGMSPHTLKVAMAFGGSMLYQNRRGIGRYGMGMKAAALSMSPVMETYSWQEPGAIYTMTLDVNAIGNDRSNLIELPDPQLIDELPSEISRILSTNMTFPKPEAQALFARNSDQVVELLGKSGTIIYMPECDRLTYRKTQTLVEHATKEMARIYRRQLADGHVKLYVNNRRVEVVDPTYWIPSARHTSIEGLQETRSRLVNSWRIEVPTAENGPDIGIVTVRLYALPIEEWSQLPRKTLRNDLHVFDEYTVSFLRNDREVQAGTVHQLVGRRHSDHAWLRLQIDFSGELDEAFGVAVNKQGVRPKSYVLDLIEKTIHDDLATVRNHIKKFQSEQAAASVKHKVSEGEQRANETDALQGKPLPLPPAPETDEEKQLLEENLRTLAVTLKRGDETDEQAFERIKNSTYVTHFKHDEYWPFYHVDFPYGKVVLTINTAHPFFSKVYEPLSRIVKSSLGAPSANGEDESPIDPQVAADSAEILVALQLLLLSLARTQVQMSSNNGEYTQLLERFRREWSANLAAQLITR